MLSAALVLAANAVVFQNVNVIPMTSDKVLARQTVLVRDGRIAAVTSAKFKLPEGTEVIDGTGKYLLPGLAEMHAHVPPPNAAKGLIEDALFEYLANGITTVRGMAGFEGQLELRSKASLGALISPTLYLAGPPFSGETVKTPQDAVEQVQRQAIEGWDLLKVYPGLSREAYDAMAQTSRKENMTFGGHVPEKVGLLHALEMGHLTFDHIDGYVEYLGADKHAIDEKKLADVIHKTKKAGAWVVPTLALWEVLYNTADLKTLQSYPELKYVPKDTVDQWTKLYTDRSKEISHETAKRVIAARKKILKAMNDAGVKILMGTDAPQQFTVPGFSLHREMLKMRDAGMTPYQILVSGTRAAGEYFKAEDSFGTVEEGKRADLLLVDANPLQDIRNASKIAGVMVRGRWYPRNLIDAKLSVIEAKYKR